MIKYYIFLIILIFILITILFHLNLFLKNNNNYNIIQINKPIENYREYFLENSPIMFVNHLPNNSNFEKIVKNIISPLTIKNGKLNNINIKEYFYHTKNKLFIYSDKDITLKLLSPKEYVHFSKSNKYNPNLHLVKPNKKQYNFIEVKLNKNNFISIPKNWIIKSSHSLNIFYSETIFSFLFTFYEIFPFIKNKLFNTI